MKKRKRRFGAKYGRPTRFEIYGRPKRFEIGDPKQFGN